MLSSSEHTGYLLLTQQYFFHKCHGIVLSLLSIDKGRVMEIEPQFFFKMCVYCPGYCSPSTWFLYILYSRPIDQG